MKLSSPYTGLLQDPPHMDLHMCNCCGLLKYNYIIVQTLCLLLYYTFFFLPTQINLRRHWIPISNLQIQLKLTPLPAETLQVAPFKPNQSYVNWTKGLWNKQEDTTSKFSVSESSDSSCLSLINSVIIASRKSPGFIKKENLESWVYNFLVNGKEPINLLVCCHGTL